MNKNSLNKLIIMGLKPTKKYQRTVQPIGKTNGKEARFKELWDKAPVAYHVLDKRGIVLDVNETEAKMLGYKKKEIIGRSIFDFVVPEQRKEARARFALKIRGKTMPRAENRRFRRKNKKDFYVSIDDVLDKDKQGRVTGIHSTMTDVSAERARYFEQSKALEEREVLNKIMNLALDRISARKMLSEVLHLMAGVSWLNVKAKGGIWLVDKGGQRLALCSSYNLDKGLRRRCGKVGLNDCVCGRAAQTGKVIFVDKKTQDRSVRCESNNDHGHYCVPIIIKKRVLGVMNLYLDTGHKYDRKEADFLKTVSGLIASFLLRAETEESLWSLLEFNKKILENAPVSIITMDLKGVITTANQIALSLSRKGNLVGKNFRSLDFFRREGLLELYENLLGEGKAFLISRRETMGLDKKLKYLDIYAVPLLDRAGRAEGCLSMALDTTEAVLQEDLLKKLNRELSDQVERQHQNEKRIRKLSEFNQKILDNLPTSVLTLDKEGGITGANRMARELMYDSRKNPVVGRNLLKSAEISANKDLLDLYRLLLARGAIFYYDNLRYISRASGQPKSLNIIAVPLHDSTGRVSGAVSLAIDNTEAVQARDKLRYLNRDLEIKVAERTGALNRVNRKLSNILDLKTKFIADASHELRTPLTVIRGNLDLAQKLAAAGRSVDIDETHLQIVEEVERMSNILADLSVLTSLDVDNEKLEYRETDLSHIVKTSVRSLMVLARQKGISLKYGEFNDNIVLIGDENKLERVFVNVIRNAIKYTDRGGSIMVSCVKNEKAKVKIRDTGIGIPPEDLPHIFERFYRVDKARSRDEGGSGLGLSIVKWIVEAHCGDISVSSQPGAGSCFEITLPINCQKIKTKASLFDPAARAA